MEATIVTVAEGTIKTLLVKLGSVLAQETLLLSGVRDEIRFLKDELAGMHAFLRNLSKMENHNDQVKEWMKQVRELAYDAEDCVDKFVQYLHRPPSVGVVGHFQQWINLLGTLVNRHRIANRIQSLKTVARDVSERRSRYGVVISTSNGDNYLPCEPLISAPIVEDSQLVGIEERKEMLLGWLMEETVPQLRTIAIVGFGGLGKTTLAMSAYKSTEVKKGEIQIFQCRAWITVSQKFEMTVLLREILRQVSENDDDIDGIETWGVVQLANMLREYLHDKRYIIVLDDIWSVLAWESIKCSLPDGTSGSRIIATTRIEHVANSCCSNQQDLLYKIVPLNKKDSKDLFVNKIFGSENACPPELESITEGILKKCGGFPLAILSVAGLLISRRSMSIELWKKVHDSLGSELETNPTLEGMRKILAHTYSDLPHDLKACFLYLCIFPMDHKISRTRLVKRWIAEGFVSERRGVSVEEVAENYFNEFVSRSIIQPLEISFGGKVKTFQIHDMILELITTKSMEENFVSLVGYQHKLFAHDNIRRLSLFDCDLQHFTTTVNLSHVRSLTAFGHLSHLIELPRLKLLRVLDLQGCTDIKNSHLKCLSCMFHLRYLNLRGTRISKLPKQISKLKYLETIDVRGTHVCQLPKKIYKLTHLKHLLAWDVWFTRKIGGQNQLRRKEQGILLSKNPFIAYKIGSLTQLNELRIIVDSCKEDSLPSLCSSLEKMGVSLRSLLIWDRTQKGALQNVLSFSSAPLLLQKLDLEGYLGKLPNWIILLNNVMKITLCETHLGMNDLLVLGKLPSLQHLQLEQESYAEKEFVIQDGFPNLKRLFVQQCPISSMTFRGGALPKLEKLHLSWQPLEELSGIQHLRSLREVFLNGHTSAGRRIVEDIRKVAENHPNLPIVN